MADTTPAGAAWAPVAGDAAAAPVAGDAAAAPVAGAAATSTCAAGATDSASVLPAELHDWLPPPLVYSTLPVDDDVDPAAVEAVASGRAVEVRYVACCVSALPYEDDCATPFDAAGAPAAAGALAAAGCCWCWL